MAFTGHEQPWSSTCWPCHQEPLLALHRPAPILPASFSRGMLSRLFPQRIGNMYIILAADLFLALSRPHLFKDVLFELFRAIPSFVDIVVLHELAQIGPFAVNVRGSRDRWDYKDSGKKLGAGSTKCVQSITAMNTYNVSRSAINERSAVEAIPCGCCEITSCPPRPLPAIAGSNSAP